MFLDEARLAARVRHPNVVPTLDIVTANGQPFLVMEYVQGESLARLLGSLRSRGERISTPIACSIVVGMLQGLHAAHEATNERAESLGIVHRDVSPQNVMVGLDGIARVLDFGVAKAAGRLQTTREGQLKGKLSYTAPELIRGGEVTRAADIYSAAVVLWETLMGERLFDGDNDANILERILFAEVVAPSQRAKDLPPALDAIVLRALDRDPPRRFATAREMARAIEAAVPIASAEEVGEWVERLARGALADRAAKMARIDVAAAKAGEASATSRRWLPMAFAAAALGSDGHAPRQSAQSGSFRSPEDGACSDGAARYCFQSRTLDNAVGLAAGPSDRLGRRAADGHVESQAGNSSERHERPARAACSPRCGRRRRQNGRRTSERRAAIGRRPTACSDGEVALRSALERRLQRHQAVQARVPLASTWPDGAP